MQHALFPPHSPLEKTPHKAGNGEISITCRSRSCPKCQSSARDKWLAGQARHLLPVPYSHVVFTLPHSLSQLALQNEASHGLRAPLFDIFTERKEQFRGTASIQPKR